MRGGRSLDQGAECVFPAGEFAARMERLRKAVQREGATGIVLGPGDLAVAHKPDEFVPIAELEAAAIYRDLALAMLEC